MPTSWVGGARLINNTPQMVMGPNVNRAAAIVSILTGDGLDAYLDPPGAGGAKAIDDTETDEDTLNRRKFDSYIEREIWIGPTNSPGAANAKWVDIEVTDECLADAYKCGCLGVRTVDVPNTVGLTMHNVLPGNQERLTLIICRTRNPTDESRYWISNQPNDYFNSLGIGLNEMHNFILRYCIHGAFMREPVWVTSGHVNAYMTVTEVYRIP